MPWTVGWKSSPFESGEHDNHIELLQYQEGFLQDWEHIVNMTEIPGNVNTGRYVEDVTDPRLGCRFPLEISTYGKHSIKINISHNII